MHQYYVDIVHLARKEDRCIEPVSGLPIRDPPRFATIAEAVSYSRQLKRESARFETVAEAVSYARQQQADLVEVYIYEYFNNNGNGMLDVVRLVGWSNNRFDT
jgi:hypothetical protein